jgi:Asp-tRNA(Asn)/Glu-tRNA(Gln) amidotransferase C subunit
MLTNQQIQEADVVSRALSTYVCELEAVRDGESTNLRFSEALLEQARELERKFNTGRYYVVSE